MTTTVNAPSVRVLPDDHPTIWHGAIGVPVLTTIVGPAIGSQEGAGALAEIDISATYGGRPSSTSTCWTTDDPDALLAMADALTQAATVLRMARK